MTETDDATTPLQKALDRYGIAASATPDGVVTATHGARAVRVRLVGDQWFRLISGTDREALIARTGAESHLAAALARELLGRL